VRDNGKFGCSTSTSIHWDVTVNAGIGMIWTEIIPVNPDSKNYPAFGQP